MRHEEDNMQIAAVEWFRLQYPNIAIHHSPNGGKRTPFEANLFKRMGTRAGFADLFIICPKKGFHGLFIEMKTRKGTQTDFQKQFEQQVTKEGYLYTICRSIDDFIQQVESYLND